MHSQNTECRVYVLCASGIAFLPTSSGLLGKRLIWRYQECKYTHSTEHITLYCTTKCTWKCLYIFTCVCPVRVCLSVLMASSTIDGSSSPLIWMRCASICIKSMVIQFDEYRIWKRWSKKKKHNITNKKSSETKKKKKHKRKAGEPSNRHRFFGLKFEFFFRFFALYFVLGWVCECNFHGTHTPHTHTQRTAAAVSHRAHTTTRSHPNGGPDWHRVE